MKISMREVGNATVLAGALNGKDALGRLLNLVTTEPRSPEPLFLEFAGIEAATASYLRESIVAFRHVMRGRDSHYYPVIANPNDEVSDELQELARARREVFMTCALAEDGTVSRPALVGDLEEKQKLTFELVQKHGETDAGELMRKYGAGEKVRHTTAWNNRLSALADLGLLVEMRHGRLKRYRPLFQGV